MATTSCRRLSRPLLHDSRTPTHRPFHIYTRLHDQSTAPSASSSTKALQNTIASTLSPHSRNTAVNPPLSTIAPPFELPKRDPTISLPVHLYRTGKTVVGFYKTGLWAVVSNLKLALAQRDNLPADAARRWKTRSDFQLQRRAFSDARRIPLFGLVLLVCGEFTPFVVLGIPGVVPGTCRMPRQVVKAREKNEKRRAQSFEVLAANGQPQKGREVKTLSDLSGQELVHVAVSLGIVKLWALAKAGLIPAPIVRFRAEKRLKYLEEDDRLIIEGGGPEGIDLDEVKVALTERGINVLNLDDNRARRILKAWLKGCEGEGRLSMLLRRPEAWQSLRR